MVGVFLGLFLSFWPLSSFFFSALFFCFSVVLFILFRTYSRYFFLSYSVFFFGAFWGLAHNTRVPSTLEGAWSVLKAGNGANVFLGKTENGVHSLFWGKSSLTAEEAYFVRERDLFYPLKPHLKVSSDDRKLGVSSYFLARLSFKLRNFLERKASKYKELSPWLFSLLMGERGKLDYKAHITFSTLGLYHLLVLSGLHFTFLGFACFFILSSALRFLYAFRLIQAGLFLDLIAFSHVMVGSFLFLYAQVVHFTAPVQRAFLAYLLYSVVSFFGLSFRGGQFLLLLLALQFLFFPMAFLGNSSLLSWASFVTILFFLEKRKGSLFWHALLSQCFLTLMVAVCCGRVSFLGLILNPLIASLFSFVYVCSFLLVFDSFFPPFMVSLFLELQKVFLVFLEKVAILPQWFPWLSFDLFVYSSFLRAFLLVFLALFFCYLLKSIKEK